MNFDVMSANLMNRGNSSFPSPVAAMRQDHLSTAGAGGFESFVQRMQNARVSTGDSTSPQTPGAAPAERNEELFELCVQLETFLIRNMINSMRSTVQRSNLIDTGLAGEIYEDMLFEEYANIFARSARLGFAEMAYQQLSGQWG